MNWILDHLQIIIAVAAAIAYWLNQRQKEKSGQDADYDGDGIPDVQRRDFQSDPEETERTRRIQDEIRRKIAERAGGGPIRVPSPAPEPPPLFRPDQTAPRPVATPTFQREYDREAEPAPAVPPAFMMSTAAILERQQDLEDQMRALEASRRSAQRKAAAVVAQTAADAPSPARGELLADLRSARNLRRAMLLREVLGPPVALR
jgi:hypothetical protein